METGRNKKRVLLVDLDPQANLTQSLGIGEQERNIYGALRGRHTLAEAVLPVDGVLGLEIVPSTLDLSGAEVELAAEAGREFILRELLEPIKNEYSYILIDSPPSLGLLTVNAFTAADKILIPLQAQFLALQGLAKLVDVIDLVRGRLNKSLEIGGVIVTQYDKRKVLNRDVAAAIEQHFPGKVFKSSIRENIALAEAPATGKDIFRYAPRSHGAEDYLALTKEILKKFK